MDLPTFALSLGPAPLFITPHPDDEAYAFGGLLHALAAAGSRPHLACATARPRTPRHLELLAALAALGLPPEALTAGDLPDGQLETSPALTPWLAALLATRRPAVVLALGPDGVYGHRDHLALWRALDGLLRAQPAPPRVLWPCFGAHPGLFAPLRAWLTRHQPHLLGPPDPAPPHHLVSLPLDPAAAAAKRAAIAAHRSQLPRGRVDLCLGRGVVATLCAAEAYAERRR